MIEHQKNGYLALPFEIEDLARGIAWVLEDSDQHCKLGDRDQEKVETKKAYLKVSTCHSFSEYRFVLLESIDIVPLEELE